MFRPCIDLHNGKVKQIVGSTLVDSDTGPESRSAPVIQTNFETDRTAASFAELYRDANLRGGHVIALGPGNEEQALAALRAFPQGLQMGGGITPANAQQYLKAGASHVIVTSYIFVEGRLDEARLSELVQAVTKERLVLDLSCRKKPGIDESAYFVASRSY